MFVDTAYLEHNPTASNDLNKKNGYKTNWGELLKYVNKQFPTSDGQLQSYRLATYSKHYLDISLRSQALIDAILGN